MVMNLLVMVIIGGYSIFTSKIDVDQHEDKPLWLEELDAGRLKIKLASSLASISGVHLLKTFIDVRGAQEFEGVAGISIEIAIHLAFIISALFLAYTEKIQHGYHISDPNKRIQKNKHDSQSGGSQASAHSAYREARRAAHAAIQAQKRAEAALQVLLRKQQVKKDNTSSSSRTSSVDSTPSSPITPPTDEPDSPKEPN